jgi:hypothetical protein
MQPEEWPILRPINFFQFTGECLFLPPQNLFPYLKPSQEKYRFPDTSSLCDEEHFAEFYMGWNPLGIEALIHVHELYQGVSLTDVTRGDSVELFFDTRNVKTSGYNTRFCHHFFFLPESVEGVSAQEITRFRTEDAHELCDPNALRVSTQMDKKGYQMHIFIPSQCLYGYDPEQIDRMGFTYRINRMKGVPQHFSVVTQEYPIEQQPSLWSSIRLKM